MISTTAWPERPREGWRRPTGRRTRTVYARSPTSTPTATRSDSAGPRADVPAAEIDRVIGGELALLDPAVRRDPARVRAVLHPEFTEFGASGRVWNRSSIVEVTSGVDEPITATEM